MGAYAQWALNRSNKRYRNSIFPILKQIGKITAKILPGMEATLSRIYPRMHEMIAGPSDIPENLINFLKKNNSLQHDEFQKSRKPRVTQCIGSLIPGGAERQLCNFVAEAVSRGENIRVLTTSELVGEHAHYENYLHRVGIFPETAGSAFDGAFRNLVSKMPDLPEIFDQLPHFLLPGTMDIFGEVLTNPPDILHTWLDHTNIWGGVAGLLANVPAIVLSTRNVNPTHFPYLAHPAFKPWYQLLATSPRVHFINNSFAGAQDYANWLNLPLDRFQVILNGVDFHNMQAPSPDIIQSFRLELGVPVNGNLVVGIFRLSEEKQPLTFVKVAMQAMKQLPHLHAAIVGVGPYESQILQAISRSGVASRFHMLGRRTDIPTILSAADVLLHTSRKEGTPNSLLEAQWLGCPVIATKAGGTIDAVKHNLTGLLMDVNDVAALTQGLISLVNNKNQRKIFGDAGPDFIKNNFSVDRMVDETLALYQQVLN
jgi:glycosyltransferase involved in cell wall biosynthesis